MSIEQKARMIIFIVPLILKTAIAQDSLMYLEALSTQAMEEFENSGRVSLKISCAEEIQYRLKTQFNYRGFELNYLDEGGKKEGEKTVSLSWSSKWVGIGMGRGQPNIAKGIILGNTMMRFTPGLSSQAGISSPKMKIKNYNYYKPLIYLTGSIRDVDISAFRYNEFYCGLVQYRYNEWHTGVSYYGLEKPVIEGWVNYKNKSVKTCLNTSIAPGKLNHIGSDLYYAYGVFSLFMSAIYLHPEFLALKSDSKWGSALRPGSQGYAGGASLTFSPWKFSCLAYCILKDDYREQRSMLDLRYKKKALEIALSYSAKKAIELTENDKFPFTQYWQEEEYGICKVNVKYQIQKELQLSYQLQGDIMHLESYVSVLRLTYRKSGNLLRFQLSNCRSWDNALYFLRPLSSSTYSIRRAPTEETLYLDLIYSRNIGMMKIYVLLRNEGMNVGFDVKI